MTGRRAGAGAAAAAASSSSSSNGNGVAPRRTSGATLDGIRAGGGGLGPGGGGAAGGRAGTSSSLGDRGQQFHPKLITTQIIALQCCHYFILGVLFQFNYLFYSTSITIDRIFTDTYVRIWHRSGWPDVSAIILASLAGSVLLAMIVEKSKKCLDFGVTLFIIHFVACWMYGGLPTVLDWWVVHVFSMIVMVLLGEYLCSRKELDDIPLLQI